MGAFRVDFSQLLLYLQHHDTRTLEFVPLHSATVNADICLRHYKYSIILQNYLHSL